MTFRIIDDTIELDGAPVATILPSVWPTKRDYLEQTLEAYDPDINAETFEEELQKLQHKINTLTTERNDARSEIKSLRKHIAKLEHNQ